MFDNQYIPRIAYQIVIVVLSVYFGYYLATWAQN